MSRRVLDQTIMSKLAKKLGNKILNVNVMVSKRANKFGISAEAALIVLAKEHGIGTSIYQRALDPSKQAEVRGALPSIIFSGEHASGRASSKKSANTKTSPNRKNSLRGMIEYLLQDQQLHGRCKDILIAPSHFDRPINQATLVLEDRIRKKSGLTGLVGEPLVGAAFNSEIAKTLLRVSSNDADDQRGFTQILRGIVPTFRNTTHHHITGKFSREDAMRVCGFIDVLLRVVDNSVKVR